jgi:hypothetical protein
MAVPSTEPLYEHHLQLEQSSVFDTATPSLVSDAATRKFARTWEETIRLGSAIEMLQSIGANFAEAETSALGGVIG